MAAMKKLSRPEKRIRAARKRKRIDSNIKNAKALYHAIVSVLHMILKSKGTN